MHTPPSSKHHGMHDELPRPHQPAPLFLFQTDRPPYSPVASTSTVAHGPVAHTDPSATGAVPRYTGQGACFTTAQYV
ncbi:hypothetical protein V501_05784 [Pseudogymnoascus sp. VKM F-4519 (FW-2642)]|nr:hypothetical protein V501_05784 [Pseudogymnoascus sp. VKM F-4519 (FW-2642)]